MADQRQHLLQPERLSPLYAPTMMGVTLRLSIPLAATWALAAMPAHVHAEQPRRGPAPAWVTPSELLPVPENASGPVFVRRQDVVVHLDEKGESQYSGYRMKILQPTGLQLGNLSIAWNPAAGAPTVHVIKVYRAGQIIDVLEKASFEILRREDQLEAASLDGMLTAVLRVADLRVGDELEVGLTTPSTDPTLGKNGAGLLVLGPSPSPGRYHLRVSWDKGRKPNLKMTPDIAEAVLKRENAIDLLVDNPTSQTPPKDAPARYHWQRVVEYSTFADWPSVSRHFNPLFAKAAKLAVNSPVKQEAARIAAAHSGRLDRASAALKMVQQDVRYIYIGLNGGNLTPASADETWQRRYGDCKGKTALLLSLLSELGVDAEAVLVNSSGADDGLNERLPSPQMFDHVLVRAHIDGTVYWLDGTMPAVAQPTSKPVIPLKWVLPLSYQGRSLEKLEWGLPTIPDEITMHEIDARAGFDKPARITNTTIVRGIKGLQQQVQFSAVSSAQLLSTFRQALVGSTWQSIDDVQWRYDLKSSASILRISGTGTVDWDDDGDGAKSLALPGGGFNPPEKRIRAADQSQDLPYYTKPEFDCRVTTVRLPLAANALRWSSKPDFDTRMFGRNYYRAFELRDGSIRMVRGSRVEREEVDAADARRDNVRIAAFDNSMAWVFYKPSSQKAEVGSGGRVPATYEIDWTASDVPCVSPANAATPKNS